jgi:tyrosine-protein phosphatase YwqE
MFSFFRKKEQKLEPLGFEVLNCDIHSHFIPGIDDGSPDLETSVKLVKKMQELGFKKIITTPHVMHDFYRNTPEIILSGLKDLKKELKTQSIQVDISAAAEYYVDYYFESKLNEGEDFLTFGNKHILIETSFVSEPPNFSESIFKLQLKGYDVILAHPERYGFMSINDLKKYKSRSVKLQLNLLSLLGYYGGECKLKAEKLIENNMVDFVGTDCHNLNQASIYHKCTTNKHWHVLVNSGTLKNHLL